MRAAEQVYACRALLSDFLGLHAPERIIFTHNTTDALNLAIKGFLRPGDHVLLSELEHNATRRPLCRLRESIGIKLTTFPIVGKSETEILSGISSRLTPRTRAIVCTHSSNICSISLPIAKIGALCHRLGIKLILDAAQSAGHLPIDMQGMHVDALAAPAHKGLYGIQGAGILALGEGFDPQPILEGGAGVDSLPEEMPAAVPERYEAGTLSTPSIASLLPGIAFIRERGIEAIAAHERRLFDALLERLSSLPHIHVYAPEARGAVLLFHCERLCATDLAAHLATRGICVRAGYHCAPMAHKALGTPEGGAVRVSFGAFNSVEEIDTLFRVLREIPEA